MGGMGFPMFVGFVIFYFGLVGFLFLFFLFLALNITRYSVSFLECSA